MQHRPSTDDAQKHLAPLHVGSASRPSIGTGLLGPQTAKRTLKQGKEQEAPAALSGLSCQAAWRGFLTVPCPWPGPTYMLGPGLGM